ncbi:MAG: FAD-dependent oxidoreductase [Fimbriimonadaceae bacterium]|nr:FAD-dependent oxidoreductase [Fimbriimonadaceae bacterium]
MKVCIVGAGVSGLAAARALKQAGLESVVYEKSDIPGGRVATVEESSYLFDSGATSVAPRGKHIERAMLEELDLTDLVRVALPIFTHSSLRVIAGDSKKNAIPRYAYAKGLITLPKLLAKDLDIRFGIEVESIYRNGTKVYRVAGEDYDAVILTPPIPQVRELLASAGESRPLANTSFRSCLSICLGYRRVLPEVGYHALLDPDQRHPLTWLSLESVKCPYYAPKGCTSLVAQMSPQFSRINFENSDEQIVEPTIEFIKRLYGQDWDQPEVALVRRWRYSQPEITAMFENVNHPSARLLIAGDGVMGGRVEYAYEAGYLAAQILIEQAK